MSYHKYSERPVNPLWVSEVVLDCVAALQKIGGLNLIHHYNAATSSYNYVLNIFSCLF